MAADRYEFGQIEEIENEARELERKNNNSKLINETVIVYKRLANLLEPSISDTAAILEHLSQLGKVFDNAIYAKNYDHLASAKQKAILERVQNQPLYEALGDVFLQYISALKDFNDSQDTVEFTSIEDASAEIVTWLKDQKTLTKLTRADVLKHYNGMNVDDVNEVWRYLFEIYEGKELLFTGKEENSLSYISLVQNDLDIEAEFEEIENDRDYEQLVRDNFPAIFEKYLDELNQNHDQFDLMDASEGYAKLYLSLMYLVKMNQEVYIKIFSKILAAQDLKDDNFDLSSKLENEFTGLLHRFRRIDPASKLSGDEIKHYNKLWSTLDGNDMSPRVSPRTQELYTQLVGNCNVSSWGTMTTEEFIEDFNDGINILQDAGELSRRDYYTLLFFREIFLSTHTNGDEFDVEQYKDGRYLRFGMKAFYQVDDQIWEEAGEYKVEKIRFLRDTITVDEFEGLMSNHGIHMPGQKTQLTDVIEVPRSLIPRHIFLKYGSYTHGNIYGDINYKGYEDAQISAHAHQEISASRNSKGEIIFFAQTIDGPVQIPFDAYSSDDGVDYNYELEYILFPKEKDLLGSRKFEGVSSSLIKLNNDLNNSLSHKTYEWDIVNLDIELLEKLLGDYPKDIAVLYLIRASIVQFGRNSDLTNIVQEYANHELFNYLQLGNMSGAMEYIRNDMDQARSILFQLSQKLIEYDTNFFIADDKKNNPIYDAMGYQIMNDAYAALMGSNENDFIEFLDEGVDTEIRSETPIDDMPTVGDLVLVGALESPAAAVTAAGAGSGAGGVMAGGDDEPLVSDAVVLEDTIVPLVSDTSGDSDASTVSGAPSEPKEETPPSPAPTLSAKEIAEAEAKEKTEADLVRILNEVGMIGAGVIPTRDNITDITKEIAAIRAQSIKDGYPEGLEPKSNNLIKRAARRLFGILGNQDDSWIAMVGEKTTSDIRETTKESPDTAMQFAGIEDTQLEIRPESYTIVSRSHVILAGETKGTPIIFDMNQSDISGRFDEFMDFINKILNDESTSDKKKLTSVQRQYIAMTAIIDRTKLLCQRDGALNTITDAGVEMRIRVLNGDLHIEKRNGSGRETVFESEKLLQTLFSSSSTQQQRNTILTSLLGRTSDAIVQEENTQKQFLRNISKHEITFDSGKIEKEYSGGFTKAIGWGSRNPQATVSKEKIKITTQERKLKTFWKKTEKTVEKNGRRLEISEQGPETFAFEVNEKKGKKVIKRIYIVAKTANGKPKIYVAAQQQSKGLKQGQYDVETTRLGNPKTYNSISDLVKNTTSPYDVTNAYFDALLTQMVHSDAVMGPKDSLIVEDDNGDAFVIKFEEVTEGKNKIMKPVAYAADLRKQGALNSMLNDPKSVNVSLKMGTGGSQTRRVRKVSSTDGNWTDTYERSSEGVIELEKTGTVPTGSLTTMYTVINGFSQIAKAA